MCLNCGCGQPDERHGNDANIVTADLRRAGEANNQDVQTTARHLTASLGDLVATGMGAAVNPGGSPESVRAAGVGDASGDRPGR